MGFNTTVVVMNDSLHAIACDPEFGKNLVHAITGAINGQKVDVPARRYNEEGKVVSVSCNAATVIESHHADGNAIVAVGGNYASVLGYSYGTHHEKEDKLRILKQLASEMGYSLRAKPKKK